ncbi:MAG: glycerophosphodiester phosphodiesterase [Planctomycetes bacterium]|nr:glycerophosphodiester phosphodiesterase [Planctomycetota bacterium]
MKPQPILKPLYISAHRGGGRVFAPDQSLPNVEHAMTLGVTAIEIDLRPTADGGIVLSHDDRLPKELFGRADLILSRMPLAEITKLRYSATVGGRLWKDLGILTADEVVSKYKDRMNFQLHVKVPVESVLELIRRHGIWDRAIVSSRDLDYLRQVKSADKRIVVEWANNTLGRYQEGKKWKPYPMPKQIELYHEAMKKLSAIGGEMLCTKLLTPEKIAICHEYGIAVRPSVMSVGLTDGARFIRMGCDGLLTDNPAKVLGGVEKCLGKDYLPKKGQSVYELMQSRKNPFTKAHEE